MSDDASTGRLLWQVTTKWRTAVDRAVAPLGLTHAQYTLLGSLYGLARAGHRPSQRELADYAGLEPIYVSKLVRALEGAGLLVRAEHPADPRAFQLTLTEHGTTVVQQAVTIVHTLHEELTAPIGGAAGTRNRELINILQTLLGIAPGEPEGNRPMAQTLTGQDIAEAQGAVTGLLNATLAGNGTEYVAMRVIAFRGPWPSRADLHDYLAGQPQLGLNDQGVTDLLDDLASKGLATGLAGDGPVQLTQQGTDLHTRLAARVQQNTGRLYAGLDQDELATAHKVLAQITRRATELRDQPVG
jgi:DNA-binding MarR family transcriptional regulator